MKAWDKIGLFCRAAEIGGKLPVITLFAKRKSKARIARIQFDG